MLVVYIDLRFNEAEATTEQTLHIAALGGVEGAPLALAVRQQVLGEAMQRSRDRRLRLCVSGARAQCSYGG